jgi:diacylglycerol kinase (ATP)
MARIQVVHNPASGSFDAKRFAALTAAIGALGHDTVISVSGPGQPFRLETGVDHVCAAGGDGTIRHVAAVLHREATPPTMSIYPMGTINLVAREIGWPSDAKQFAQHIDIESKVARIWPVAINENTFVACASIGPDAWAVDGVSTALKARIGRLAYGVAMVKALTSWRRPTLRVSADGAEFACEAIYIAKGRFFAGPWSFAPDARLDQPDLHVVALPVATRLAFIGFLLRLGIGGMDRWAGVRVLTCKSLSVECDQPQPVQIDGDIGCATPVRIAVTDRPICG